MDRDAVIQYLRELPVEEMVAVFRAVFAVRVPWPDESDYCDNRFCLAVASRDKPEDSDGWEPCVLKVVGYVNRTEYDGTDGPDYGLCQVGSCGNCGVHVLSNVKHGVCPACSADVYMT